ncbi:hypothetical protein BJ508DRAFT_213576, partial [Ascobolus immersus RN42]
MKSASWFSWILHQSLVYFYTYLPHEHFVGYSKFVQAMRLCCRRRLYPHEVRSLDRLINEFVDYVERDIYKLDMKRLHVWKPVLHQLLHVVKFIRLFGPMSLYAQWTIER